MRGLRHTIYVGGGADYIIDKWLSYGGGEAKAKAQWERTT